jgi:hypothetical protein
MLQIEHAKRTGKRENWTTKLACAAFGSGSIPRPGSGAVATRAGCTRLRGRWLTQPSWLSGLG